MGEMIPPHVKKLWNKWNIRGIIILSLFFQSILLFFAPNRRRSAQKLFLVLIWSSYVLADSVADYAVGQISDSQEEEAESKTHSKNSELLAFWSPFFLLHLGGQDTITALALEDNQLWDRHLFGAICQALATVYVILLSIPNGLLTPTAIMLVGGVIKYVERIAALFSASIDKFKDSLLKDPDPGANYARLMDAYEAKRSMNMPTQVILVEGPEEEREGNIHVSHNAPLTPLQVVLYAYKYFNIFKGILVDLIFTIKERDESREFFNSLNPEQALSIIEVELGLIYDSMFTKAEILQSMRGVVFRFVALGCLIASLCLFKMAKKDQYEGFDVALTYALLICGIALDSIALLMFCVSDFTIARWHDRKHDLYKKDTWIDGVGNWILHLKTLKWKKSKCFQDGGEHHLLNRHFVFRRWSEHVHAYNLIGFCLGIRPKKIHTNMGKIHCFFHKTIHILYIDIAINKVISGTRQFGRSLSTLSNKRVMHTVLYVPRHLGHLIFQVLDFFGVNDLFAEIKFTVSDGLTKELWELIFREVRDKHRFAHDLESAKQISSARGNWTLVQTSSKKTDGSDYVVLLKFVTEKDYDQSILLWHIATELFYQDQIEKEVTDKDEHSNREFSKILSDYMMYLIIMQPTLMSSVSGIAKRRFADTCEEAKEFFKTRNINNSEIEEKDLLIEASRAILSLNTDVDPAAVEKNRSKSVFFYASVLAKKLKRLNEGGENMWGVLSKVWVEMLCYAANHCSAQQHASQLNKGGELINFVWLLMTHFGLRDQFQINRDATRVKLIVGK